MPRLTLKFAFCLLAALTLSAAPAVAQHDDDDDRDRDWLSECRSQRHRNNDGLERFCELREMGMRPPRGTLVVDARQNGGISVESWDRDSVHVELRIRAEAESEEEAREIARDIRVNLAEPRIRAEGPSSVSRRRWTVSFAIKVPRGTDLDLETHNGPVSVHGVRAKIDIRAENGPLVLDQVGGDVRARTRNGPLVVTLAGSRWDGAGLDAETTNGPISLTVPEGYSARLEAATTNGPVSLGFPITMQGVIVGRQISTTLGDGGALVRVVTTNGPVVLRRSRSRDR